MKFADSTVTFGSLCLVVLVTTVISIASAPPASFAAGDKKVSFLRQNDGDGDKKLSLDEYVSGVTARVSVKTQARLAETVTERFRKADQNGDGLTDGERPMNLEKFTKVSARRATARATKRAAEKARTRFTELDTNGDSFVDSDEIRAAAGQ